MTETIGFDHVVAAYKSFLLVTTLLGKAQGEIGKATMLACAYFKRNQGRVPPIFCLGCHAMREYVEDSRDTLSKACHLMSDQLLDKVELPQEAVAELGAYGARDAADWDAYVTEIRALVAKYAWVHEDMSTKEGDAAAQEFFGALGVEVPPAPEKEMDMAGFTNALRGALKELGLELEEDEDGE